MEDNFEEMAKNMGFIPMEEPSETTDNEVINEEIVKEKEEEVNVEKVEAAEEQAEPVEEEVKEEKEEIVKEEAETEEVVETKKYKASEIFNKVEEAVKEKYGMSYAEATRIKSIDIDELASSDQKNLVAEGMRLADPEMSEKAIKYKLKKFDVLFKSEDEWNEMIEEGTITQDKIEGLDIEFEELLRVHSKSLRSKQDEIDLDIELDGFAPDVQPKQDNNPTQEDIDKLTSEVSLAVNAYEKETIKIVDKDGNILQEFDYAVKDEDRTGLQENMLSSKGFNRFWEGETNDEVLRKMSQAMFYLDNKEKIHKSIYDQGQSAGELKTAEDISNIDFTDKSSSANGISDDFKSMREAHRLANGE